MRSYRHAARIWVQRSRDVGMWLEVICLNALSMSRLFWGVVCTYMLTRPVCQMRVRVGATCERTKIIEWLLASVFCLNIVPYSIRMSCLYVCIDLHLCRYLFGDNVELRLPKSSSCPRWPCKSIESSLSLNSTTIGSLQNCTYVSRKFKHIAILSVHRDVYV